MLSSSQLFPEALAQRSVSSRTDRAPARAEVRGLGGGRVDAWIKRAAAELDLGRGHQCRTRTGALRLLSFRPPARLGPRRRRSGLAPAALQKMELRTRREPPGAVVSACGVCSTFSSALISFAVKGRTKREITDSVVRGNREPIDRFSVRGAQLDLTVRQRTGLR